VGSLRVTSENGAAILAGSCCDAEFSSARLELEVAGMNMT